MAMDPQTDPIYTREEIKQKIFDIIGIKPCHWQVDAALAQLSHKDVVVIAPTGMGKTLAFLIPVLIDSSRSIIIVSPLTTLSEQHATSLVEKGVSAIALSKENFTEETLSVSNLCRSCYLEY
jgi:superfamily II DNA helicase RecQ